MIILEKLINFWYSEYYCAENTIIEQGTPAKFQTEDLESC